LREQKKTGSGKVLSEDISPIILVRPSGLGGDPELMTQVVDPRIGSWPVLKATDRISIRVFVGPPANVHSLSR